ncbi:MAG: AMP-binding protein, partial [Cyanobacteria bacterium P01_F01_bin.53]
PLYNMAFLFTFSGELDPTHFQAAFQALVQRCDALRTVIEEVDGVPQQRVQDPIPYSVPVLDFRGEMSPEDAVRAWGEARSQTLFNLSERLFDTALLQCPDGTVWYLNQHHLITDMVSLKRLYEVMGELYARSLEGTLAQAPELTAYADVVLPAPASRAVEYWQKQQISPSSLYHRTAANFSARSSARSAGAHESTASRRISCVLTAEQTAALKTLSIESEAAALTPQLSLFNLVSGLVLAYLHRISGDPRVAFSTPAQGRPSRALKETIGVFIELFPLAVEVDSKETFASLLTKVSEASGGFLRHAQPGASEFVPKRDANVVLNFLTAKVSDFAGLPVRAEWLHAGASDPHHHLRILVHDFDDRGCLQLHFDFNNELFDPALQERGPSHFLALVNAVLADRNQPIAEVDLLNEAEKYRLDELGQSSQMPSIQGFVIQGLASQDLIDQDLKNQTVVQQFEAQVERTLDAIALVCDDITLTYRQLNAKANQLAHSLQHQAILPEAPVALCFHRSPDMLVAIWGVLKAGGAYVPLEPSHPKERIAHILQDTRAQWVLTQADLADRLSGEAIVLTLDTLNLEAQPTHNLPISPWADQLAYCLYTSGSTGKPKGVEIEHRSLLNYVQWAQQQYVRGRSLAFPLFSPLAFDLTVTSIYVPLTSGGQVVIYPESECVDAAESGATIDLSLQRIFQDNAVDVINL